jgi:hypothetical protein
MFSQCRHIPGTWRKVNEFAEGTKGRCGIGAATIYNSNGDKTWSYGRGGGGGHQQEHHDLFADLRAGKRPNEGEYGALSTMTSIFGRMASYSGKEVQWDKAINSDLIISPVEDFHDFSDTPPTLPDDNGNYRIPVPGITKPV